MNGREHQLLRLALDEARQLGIIAHHCGDSRRCEGLPGFPDLLLATSRGLILAELKSEDGETSADQDMWLWTLNQAVDGERYVSVWRPADFWNGTVTATLKRLVP